MKFVLASHNKGKLAEMQAVLAELGIEVVMPAELGIDVDVEETGETFAENAALKAKIAAIPDDWYYFNSAGIGDMMRFYKGFYPNFSTERYEKLREVFELDEKRPIRRFSKGMQKQAAFWLALSAMPDYLILDEPVTGLDPAAALDLYRTLDYLNGTEGIAVIMVTHDITAALSHKTRRAPPRTPWRESPSGPGSAGADSPPPPGSGTCPRQWWSTPSS